MSEVFRLHEIHIYQLEGSAEVASSTLTDQCKDISQGKYMVNVNLRMFDSSSEESSDLI